MLTNWFSSNFSSLPRLAKFPLSIPPSFTWFFLKLVFYKLNFVSLQGYSLTFLIFWFLYFSLTFLSFSLAFSFLILLLPSWQHIKGRESWFVLFLMANDHFTLNESFCFYLTAFIKGRESWFYSIYFKIPRKISAQSGVRIENYAQ